MKSYVAITLILVGGLIILGPLYSIERNKDRIAEFYTRNGSAVVLPDTMQPKSVFVNSELREIHVKGTTPSPYCVSKTRMEPHPWMGESIPVI